MPDLSNKSAIVTGGASGLGAAVAAHLAGRGAKVCLFDMNADAATATAAKLGATWQQVDVSDPDSVKAAFEKARATQGQERILDQLRGHRPRIQNGFARRTPRPAFVCKGDWCEFAGFVLLRINGRCGHGKRSPSDAPDGERGVVVNTASVAAYEGQVGQVAYAASKGAGSLE